MSPTQLERVRTAEVALNAFMDERPNDDGAEVIRDLLANLMHMCDCHCLDFDARLELARMHYQAECQEEAAE